MPDREPQDRDAPASPIHPVLTEEQGARLWEAIATWQHVAAEAGNPVEFTPVNIRKSCLLGRLLYEGKPPLPKPPPTAYSAPWYSLIEDGRAYLDDGAVYYLGSNEREPASIIICQYRWRIVEVQEPPIEGWLLTYGDGTERWMLRRFMENEERPIVGKGINGHPDLLAEWLLARRTMLEPAGAHDATRDVEAPKDTL